MNYTISLEVYGSDRYEQGIAFAYAAFIRTHGMRLAIYPEILAVAKRDGDIVGTLGLGLERGSLHFFEQCNPSDPLGRFVPQASRTAVAEVTRFALAETLTARQARALTETLSTRLLNRGYEIGLRYFGFVGRNSFCAPLKSLGIHPVQLGVPTFAEVPRSEVGTYMTQKNLSCFMFCLPEKIHRAQPALQLV